MNGRKILIVDDDPVFLKAVSARLKANGFVIATAEDGGSGLAQTRDFQPDLILLDVTFPPDVAHGGGIAWNGILLMNWIHQTSDTRVPVIIITATEGPEIRTRAMAAGAAGFLQKPVGGDELIEVIRKVLRTYP